MKRGVFLVTVGSAALAGCAGGGAAGTFLPSSKTFQGTTEPTPVPSSSPSPAFHEFGIQIHPNAPYVLSQDLPLVVASGAMYCRCDFAWNEIENPAGTFDWTWYDQLYASLLEANIIPIFLTQTGNEQAYGFTVATTPSQIQQYVTFHTLAAQRYPQAWWEICNEPDLAYFWPPAPSAAQYAALATAVIPPIRAAIAPTSKLLSGGTSGIDIIFIESFWNAGVSGLVDYVAFHPYGIDADALASSLAPLKSVVGTTPLFCSEYGVTVSTTSPVVTPAQQASDLTAMANACGALKIPFVWYELIDEMTPTEIDPVNEFGLYSSSLSAKPSLTAAQSFATGAPA